MVWNLLTLGYIAMHEAEQKPGHDGDVLRTADTGLANISALLSVYGLAIRMVAADDALAWLQRHGLVNRDQQPIWTLREY